MNQAMNESKTPRTDYLAKQGDAELSDLYAHARQIETELDAEHQDKMTAIELLNERGGKLTALMGELAAERKRVAILDQENDRLNEELTASHAQNQRLLSLVRLQRGELHQKNAISDEEYAALAADVASRSVLDTHDTLRGEIEVLEKQIQKCDKALAASHAREVQLRDAIKRIPEDRELPAHAWKAIIATESLPAPRVVPLALAEKLADGFRRIKEIYSQNTPAREVAHEALREYEAWRAAK